MFVPGNPLVLIVAILAQKSRRIPLFRIGIERPQPGTGLGTCQHHLSGQLFRRDPSIDRRHQGLQFTQTIAGITFTDLVLGQDGLVLRNGRLVGLLIDTVRIFVAVRGHKGIRLGHQLL